MSLHSILLVRCPIEPSLVDGRAPSSSCYRRVLGGYERPPRIRLFAIEVSHLGRRLNGVSSLLDGTVGRSKACRRSLATGRAIYRFHQDRKRFPMGRAVEVQHASS